MAFSFTQSLRHSDPDINSLYMMHCRFCATGHTASKAVQGGEDPPPSKEKIKINTCKLFLNG